MRIGTLIWFYSSRLRVQWMQELLAGLGIVIGVALLFSVQVANSSIATSAREMAEAVAGRATLQLTARGPEGLSAAIVARARQLPGVAHAAATLEHRGALDYRGHRVPVEIVGVDEHLSDLGGTTVNSLLGLPLEHGLLLPIAVARSLGIASNATPDIGATVHGHRTSVPVGNVLDARNLGVLADASLAVMYLPYAQELIGAPGRITRILVVPRAGHERSVRRELGVLANGRATVSSTDIETRLLERASAPNDQATGLFAAVSAVAAILFAFNAMLLTTPERRAALAELRLEGYQPSQLAQILGFQIVLLGAVSSALGLLVGDLLSRAAAGHPPAYLAFAFPLGTHRVVPPTTLILAWAGGVFATCIAGILPILDSRSTSPLNLAGHGVAEPGHTILPRTRRKLAFVALLLGTSTSMLVLVVPSTALIAILGLAATTVLIVPLAFEFISNTLDRWAKRSSRNALVLAIRALRESPIRAFALAATGAVAVFGSVSIEGAHRDLLRGLDRNFADYLNTADLWITVGGDENGLTTEAFDADRVLDRVRDLPVVENARAYYGGLVDVGDRRVWVIGRPSRDRALIPPSQMKTGNLQKATLLVRHRGWAAVSDTLAQSQHAGVGGWIRLPTPAGMRRVRVAATLTNLGWGPGAVIMNATEYRRAWRTNDPSAIEVDIKPGSSPGMAARQVRAALEPNRALTVQTVAQRHSQFDMLAEQGLTRLSQISTLMLIAAALAMAAAMGAAIWQRRLALARMQIDGYTPGKLWRILLLETSLVLVVGCFTGALAGTYGHLLGAYWLELSTGFPAPSVIGPAQPVVISFLVAAVALTITAVPGYLASRTPPHVGLEQP